MASREMFDLLKIGLTEGEAKVYLALSEIGSSTVGPIVKKSSVAYSNIYDILNRLIDKGVVSFIIKEKTKYFTAAPPVNLIEYLNNKEKEIAEQKQSLNKILPDLEKLQEIKDKENAEIFIGKKGLRTAYEKLLKNTSKKDEELFFYFHEKDYAEESDMFYMGMFDVTRKIKGRGICNKNYKKSSLAKKLSKYMPMRFTDNPIPGNIDIIKDKVLITSWRDTIFAVLIQSQDLADSLREYFEHMWKISKK